LFIASGFLFTFIPHQNLNAMFFQIIIALIVVGIVIWLVNEYLPIDPKFKRLINIVAVVGAIFYILKVTGAWGYLSHF
jgi:hypothetical protein